MAAEQTSLKKPNKKHIGFIHYTLPPAISGVEMVIRDHARLLSSNGYHIYLIGATGKKFRSEIEVQIARSFHPKNKDILTLQEELKKGKLPRFFSTIKNRYKKTLREWIKKNSIGVVIVHNVLSRHYNLALTAAIVELAEELHDSVKFITWVHDASFIDEFYTKVNKELKGTYPWNLIAQYQPHFQYVTISNVRRNELFELYGKNIPIEVVPNGIDINKMLPLPLQTRALFMEVMERQPAYIGLIPVRIAERKNIEYAIEFAKVARDYFKTKIAFLVTGALHLQNAEATKYYDFLKQEIKKNDLEDQFFFLYNYKLQSGEKFDIYSLNIRDLYLITDFLFFPSKGEGFGLPIIEAGFMRLPIFTSDLPVFKEVGNGYINTFNLKQPVKDTVEFVLETLQSSRATKFHKTILKQYSLSIIVKEKIIPLLSPGDSNTV